MYLLFEYDFRTSQPPVTNRESTPESGTIRDPFTSRSDDSASEAVGEVPSINTPSQQTKNTVEDLDDWAHELAGIVFEYFLFTVSEPGHNSQKDAKKEREPERYNGDAIVWETPLIRKSHFACPFYMHDKERHFACLTRADIRDIEGLKEHLWTNHRQPSYCPTCHITFTASENWGDHIRRRSCVSSGKSRPEGITALQMQVFAQPVKPCVSREDQYLEIYETLFPGVGAPSLFVPAAMETMVWALRDFWAVERDQIVSSYLTKQEQHRPQLRRLNVDKLGSLVLQLMIDQLIARLKQGEESGP